MNHPERDPIRPGQESVWDYPRPPALRWCDRRIRVVLGGEVVCDAAGAWQVLETSHPPTHYVPREAFGDRTLSPAAGSSYCEWKGAARYFDLHGGGQTVERAAWSYPQPFPGFARIAGHIALYAHVVDACFIGEEEARPQPGRFYGGWITDSVVGPFKGVPGSQDW